MDVAADPLTYPFATRWSRFFARAFDVSWETLLLAFLSGFVLNRYSPAFVEWINSPGSIPLFGIICLPLAMVLDAMVYQVFGNTPGKALLRLKVITLRGERLSLVQYLSRNFAVWIHGLALGIPGVNLVTLVVQFRRLGKDQQTTYDEGTVFRVRSQTSGLVLRAVFGLAFAGLLGSLVAFNAIEREADRVALSSKSPANYTWENPQTRRGATIDSKWKHAIQSNEKGQKFHKFSEFTNHAVVILGVERAPGYALRDYIRAFRRNASAGIRFSDRGSFFEVDGHQAWQVAGSTADDATARLSIQVIQLDSGFWRIVTVQATPYEYSDPFVKQLQTSLWSTVK
jgi:uncharacterized RDD family membrane protein YckC